VSEPTFPVGTAAIGRAVSRVLQWGFRISASLLVAGMVVTALRGEDVPDHVDDFSAVLPAILDGRTTAIVDLAILSMMITPVVAALVVARGFAKAGDRRYAGYSLAVLLVLVLSVSLSLLR
jgi:uncharacterized membrane protein